MTVEIRVPRVLNPETLDALGASLAAVDPEQTRILILKGEEGTFCKGLDLRWVTHSEVSQGKELTRFSEILAMLHAGPFITIAVVEGDAVGGGVGIAAACDWAFAAPSARFALTEGMLGLMPGIILPFLLDKLTPASVKLMVFGGRSYSAESMARWGLIHEVVDRSTLDGRVRELVQSLRCCKRHVIGPFKRMLALAASQNSSLAEMGIQNLVENLNRPSVRRRLAALVELGDAV